MSIADGLLWAPDLAVFNPHTVEDIWGVNPQNLILHYSGTVKWVPPTMMRANCIPDLTMWPRDTHSCKLIIGSWKHTGNMLDLQIAGEPKLENSLDYNISVSSSLWEILEANTTREKMYFLGGDVPEFYVTIDVHLEVRRYAPSITSIVFVPALCLSLLTLFVFLLHPKSGEKINLGGVSVILDLIFLIFIVSLVGHSHATTPLLVKLALLQLVMATISVLASALVLRLTSNPRSTGIPACFHRPLTLIAKCLFLGNYSEIVSQPAEKNSGDDFLVLAAATDRVLLLVFLAVCVSNIALFSSVM